MTPLETALAAEPLTRSEVLYLEGAGMVVGAILLGAILGKLFPRRRRS